MKSIIAFIFPWSLFMTLHRPAESVVCLLLQISIFGWIPAAIWAIYILYRDKIA
ncbi:MULTISPECIES: YqaE/Pmp3 family membrane protein [Acinetobacter]|uniref:YqaE/Pmp3 family membrane protein n=1 Tax=Acinetobacter pecorum TaxID=2762215 RepID=A0ABR8VTN5_9GAMM|nr:MULTISPECIES: YqaE/Pmp3 family membrane protein [Acinetobacter]MBD8008139.1 YqaE/Pmp3 family membrane protein [Acinetobacter pecorum]